MFRILTAVPSSVFLPRSWFPRAESCFSATLSAAADRHRGLEEASQQRHGVCSSSSACNTKPEAAAALGFVRGGFTVDQFPPETIRNFCIIAHVDHGKSTLADRLMEMTGAIVKGSNAQYLDKLQVERDRGITVKAQSASLVYKHKGTNYLLNLIDTPGHVDFSYEVSRSLAACQGALLVVDAGQGIQAQTVANFHLATEQRLALVPVVNKVDLPAAEPSKVAQQLADTFGMDTSTVLMTSAKTGKGLASVLPAVIEHIPPPSGSPDLPLRMLLFDAFHDEYRGVICLVLIVDGSVVKGDRIVAASTGEDYEVHEVGIFAPEPHPTGRLRCGQVGYIVPGIKSIKAVRVGDTMHHYKRPVAVLPGFKPAKAMVFAGLYPVDGEDFEDLCSAMDKLTLSDASVVIKKENSEALGPGFRAGFLGMLHMEVFMQRLEQEYGASVVTTTPTVTYILDFGQGETLELERPSDYPLDRKVLGILEPTVIASVVAPSQYQGRVMQLFSSRRGELLEQSAAGEGRFLLRYILPLAELATDFYSEVKSLTQGYATFDYEEGQYRPADLQRLDILAHSKPVDALARLVAVDEISAVGRSILEKMSRLMEKQQFDVVLQACADGRIVARETIRARRKNVLAKCYGGDVTRKRKLLDKQKDGKRKLKRLGNIEVPQELFPELMKAR